MIQPSEKQTPFVRLLSKLRDQRRKIFEAKILLETAKREIDRQKFIALELDSKLRQVAGGRAVYNSCDHTMTLCISVDLRAIRDPEKALETAFRHLAADAKKEMQRLNRSFRF